MVKEWMCALCGAKFDHDCPDGCESCGAPCVGWIDSAGGYHEGGCGTMPDGTFCGECCKLDCADCSVWKDHMRQRQQYGRWCCEECGEPLEIWLDELEEEHPAEGNSFRYERRHLMWHCAKCGRDYENYWETQWGDSVESMPQRKYWG